MIKDVSLSKGFESIETDPNLNSEEKVMTKQSLGVMISPANIEIMDKQVGDPLRGESRGEYLERAKAVVFDMIDKSFKL